MKVFSYKNRPVHLGPFPMESLRRSRELPDLLRVPNMKKVRSDHPYESLAHPIHRYLAMLDILRDGVIEHAPAQIPEDAVERANHLKAASYFFGASMVGACDVTPEHFLEEGVNNPNMEALRQELKTREFGNVPNRVESMRQYFSNMPAADYSSIAHHKFALLLLSAHTREPRANEPGTEWIRGIQAERAALLGVNTAVLVANYIRRLGYEARVHSLTTTEVDLNRLGVSAGLCLVSKKTGQVVNPFLGTGFGLTAITTTMEIAPDKPLAQSEERSSTWAHGVKWAIGLDGVRNASNFDPFSDRQYHMGPFPYEKTKRVDTPTTYMDEERIPRIPDRAQFFHRAMYGDLGQQPQMQWADGLLVLKNPIGACAMTSVLNIAVLQYGPAQRPPDESTSDPRRNALNIKATGHFLTAEAIGLSRLPEWAYYSHDSEHRPLLAEHGNSIALLLDQGHETMEGASGDDWVSAAQSTQSYVRGSVISGVIAEQLRRLGHSARVHSAIDGQVIQPPLLVLAGLGEISRIGDTILNPYLGPRVKSSIVSTSMPMIHDKPIDFGLQSFCNQCNKCARECPSGAITAGPKVMFNGYEIWRSDSEKCTRYRTTNAAGSMCGRCMKTCPWNLEGLFADAAFRWMAMNAPSSATMLAKLDDALDRGTINPVKKWWWDLQYNEDRSAYVLAKETNKRELQKELNLKYADQSLAAYPADLTPSPLPVAHPVNRDEGIEQYRSLLSVAEYKERIAAGQTEGLVPHPGLDSTDPEAFPVKVSQRIELAEDIIKLELRRPDGLNLPSFEPGAHIDIVVAPHFVRQFSLCGDPLDLSKYVVGIKREIEGRGGSARLFREFREGRRIFISAPRNHFPLHESASFSILMAGGIGITPLIAMAHRLHALDRPFILHYSAKSAASSGFSQELSNAPWSDKVFFHFSQENRRAVFEDLVPHYKDGFRLYVCGGDRYMNSVLEVTKAREWPEECISLEYFSAPDEGERDYFPFKIKLAKSGKIVEVPAESSACEALAAAGIHVDVKCSSGLCGVCTTRHLNGDIDHRDYVLSAKERTERVALCCSRTVKPDQIIEIDL